MGVRVCVQREGANCVLDVMIVDTGADLNVYLETGQDGERKGGCCAPEAGTGCGDAAGVTVSPAVADSGCCAPGGVVSDKTDLNEFVGKSSQSRDLRGCCPGLWLTSDQARTRSLLSRNETVFEYKLGRWKGKTSSL